MGQRQLKAIMFTDLVGYSALTQRNEPLALELLERHWELLRPVFTKFDGHEIKTIGDAFLIEFPSALQAVEAGLAMQQVLVDYNYTVDDDHAIQVRIGIHLGDVERRGDDVFGDGVNIASRLEPLARPGGVCISEPVYISVSNKVGVTFYPMGSQRLKNISQSIVVYSNHPADKARFIKSRRYSLITGMTMATVIVILAILTFTWIKDESPVIVTSETETKTEEKAASLVVADRKSVAVLPFANHSKSDDDTYFVDGIHDDILTQIAKIASLTVISRTSVMQYRNTEKTMKTVGDELGVATILEGGVQLAGNRVRINVQLINVDTDKHLWAETYNKELTTTNIFEIQEQIAIEVASALRATLSPEVRTQIATVPIENLDAYKAYLQGMHYINGSAPKGIETGLTYLHEAVERDPGSPLAYAGLAIGYVTISHGAAPPEGTWQRAQAAAIRALNLDPNLAEAYLALGNVKLYFEWDFAGAEQALLRSIELNPSLAMSHYHYAWYLALTGRLDEAIVEHKKSRDLDPLSPLHTAWLGGLYMYQGDYDLAIIEARRSMELNPNFPPGLFILGAAYLGKGLLNEAIAAHEQLVAINPNWQFMLGVTYALAGRNSNALEILTALEKTSAETSTSWTTMGIGLIHAALGNKNEAIHWLAKEPHHAFIPWFVMDPLVEPLLRDNPNFTDFLTRMALPERSCCYTYGIFGYAVNGN